MLSRLSQNNIKSIGIDPSEGFIEYIKSKGIPVYRDLPDLQKEHPQKFDLIIHYYVLEHISEPLIFIKDYMKLLNDHGKMIFEVPCATDPLIELYKVSSFDKFYWSIAHHWYFNKTSLVKLLENTGFRFDIFPEQRYDLSNHITWMNTGKPGGLGVFSHIFGEELDELYKNKLKESWYCDTLTAVIWKS
jgi:SAM-dependent methyltransferase